MSAPRLACAAPRLVLATLAALALCAGCFSKESPPEVPPSAHEPAPPPPASTPPPPSSAPPRGYDGAFDFGGGPAPEERAPTTPSPLPEQAKPRGAKTPKTAARPSNPAPARSEGSAAPKPTSEAKRELESGDESERARALMEQLRSTRSAPAADCPAAREQRDTICALAERICRLLERDPNVASIADYCSEARRRCVDAGRRTAERCD